MNENNFCVIFAGGVGSRFWPYSRNSRPKQFLDFYGTGRSLLQMTFDRFARIFPKSNILIATEKSYKDLILEQLEGIDPSQVILEPVRRNTAPCIAYSLAHIRKHNPKANMVLAPSDHLITKEAEFLQAVQKGLDFVSRSGSLLTLGIKPNRPETNYGYIQASEEERDGFLKVKTFTEKPNRELAKEFIESGEFYWNAGIFMWNAETIYKAFWEFLPDIAGKFDEAMPMIGTPSEEAYINDMFPTCQNISIDYGIMEHAKNVHVLSGDFGWSDLGTWGSLYDLSPKDDDGNVILKCRSLTYDCADNIVVLPEGRLAVLHGLKDYIVVESDKALLICKKSEEGRIRQFVNDVNLMEDNEDFI